MLGPGLGIWGCASLRVICSVCTCAEDCWALGRSYRVQRTTIYALTKLQLLCIMAVELPGERSGQGLRGVWDRRENARLGEARGPGGLGGQIDLLE